MKINWMFLTASSFFLLSCGSGQMNTDKLIAMKIEKITPKQLALLAQQHIFFGHQSVGQNIIDGLSSLQRDFPELRLGVSEFEQESGIKGFVHGPIGKNMDPVSKIDDFVDTIDKGIGGKVDIAFFKFCYVDVTAKTDVDALFNSYREAMDRLSGRYPGTLFLHTTVPLTIVQTGTRAWIKKVIGRPLGGYADNVQRNRYNELLRNAYGGKSSIFDLAAIEATQPDGKPYRFKHRGRFNDALYPAYASDGRHLNASGARLAAAEMVLSMVGLLSEKGAE